MGEVVLDLDGSRVVRPATSLARMISCRDAVTEYVSAQDWRVKANANVG